MNHGSTKMRRLADGVIGLEKLYSTTNPIEQLRYPHTSLPSRKVVNKLEARSYPELTAIQGGGAIRQAPDRPKVDRKRVLDELGAVLTGSKSKKR